MDYYNRKGEPVTQEEWAERYMWEDIRVKLTEFEEQGIRVSTIWLGIDQAWGDMPAPLIFETMVFMDQELSEDDPLQYWDEFCARYPTEEVAVAEHVKIVATIQRIIDNQEPKAIEK